MKSFSKQCGNKNILLRSLLFFTILLSGFSGLVLSCSPRVTTPIILFVFKDQSDTPSLNPTRLLTASQLAQEEFVRRNSQESNQLPKIIYLTYSGYEDNGVTLAREFIESNPQVIAIIGDINSQGTRLLAQLAKEKQLLHLSFFATDESIFEQHSWSFSYRERISNETEVLLYLLSEYLKTSNTLIVSNDLQNLTPRWVDLETRIGEIFGVTPPVIITQRSQIDFSNELSKIEQMYPDIESIVLILSSQQNQHFLQQVALHQMNIPVIISSVGLDPDHFLEFSGLDLEMYSFTFQHFLDYYQNKHLSLDQFVQRYQVSMGFRRIDSLGPWIYDGVLLLLESVESASTPTSIHEYFSTMELVRLVGTIGFDASGNISRNTFLPIQLKDGRIRELSK